MHIIHSYNNKKIEEHAHSDVGFLITNKKGNYLSLGEKNFSHTQGLFFFDHEKWGLYKTIEDIKISKKMIAIKNNIFNTQRLYKDGAEENFNLFNDCLLYSVKKYTGDLVLELDFRAIFDYNDKGRVYSITQEDDDFIIIKYDKYFGDDLSVIDKTFFFVIKGAKKYKPGGDWVRKEYSYDAKRKTKSEFYIYKALSLKVDKQLDLVFSFSYDKNKAKAHAQKIYENKDYLVNSYKKYIHHTFTSKDIALNTAMKALDDLLVSLENGNRSVGVLAGLPWFFQFWARDELICLKALMLQQKYYLTKSILFKYLSSITDDGLIPNRIPGNPDDAKSIDAVGWLFLRIRDYIRLLVSKKIFNDYFSVSDLIKIKKALEKSIQGLLQNHLNNGLLSNNMQETWMDTKNALRNGHCIEVQALFLSMLNFHNHIAGITRQKPLFKSFEKEYREKVKKEFFNNGILYDTVFNGKPNNAVRPNVFLAYYAYPDLLTKKEWKQAFDKVLKELWLGWGGLATLGHKNPLFKSEYTGQDDLSYHNGDSWYYLNNYAAIAMHSLDKDYYSKKIKRILEASKEEMLFSGFIACCAELSSAKNIRSEGCLSQAWSAASFIELWHEMHV